MENIKRDKLSRARITANKRNDYEEREPEGGLQPVSSFSNFIALSVDGNEKINKLQRRERSIRVRNRRNICVVKQSKRSKNIISSSLNSKSTKVVTVVKIKRNGNIKISNNIPKVGKVIKVNRNKKYRNKNKYNKE